MSRKLKPASESEFATRWLELHDKCERALLPPTMIAFHAQAERIEATIKRIKPASGAEFLLYYDADAEAKWFRKHLFQVLDLIAQGGATAAWQARPKHKKGLGPFKLPRFIRRAIKKFFGELRDKNYWQKLQQASGNRAAQVIEQSLDKRLSFPNMAKEVRKVLSGAVPGRAMAVARTETTGAMNAGQQVSLDAIDAELSGSNILMLKQWLSIIDKKTREDHIEANEQKIPANSVNKFIVGGAELRYPGDPDAPPEQRINCRCAMITIFEE